ncbi:MULTISPECIES: hypothetical protein [unclassified Erythrobacter]|nr:MULTISPECIES: hypothetical protein [unclassified Erythrobacter]
MVLFGLAAAALLRRRKVAPQKAA